jgi:flagellar basal-body rod protein FlgG
MLRGLWTAATGMVTQQTNIDVIANNLANVNTAGFKKSRANFEDLIYQTFKHPGTLSAQGNEIPTGIQIGHGAKTTSVQKMFTEGNFKHTGNDLDLAIEGRGFFKIVMPDGTDAYTRDGSFKMNSAGELVTADGYKLSPSIVIPTDTVNITVSDDGTVSVLQAGQTTMTQVGNITLTTFVNPSGLKSIGKNLFKETGASGTANEITPGTNGAGTISQGFLEMSNVSVVEEMVDMITGQRAYEVNSKTVQTADSMLQTAINVKR